MIKVKLSNNFPDWDIKRQTPASSAIWGNCQFFINQNIDECDYWIVYEGLLNEEKVKCPKENIIFISGEPPIVRSYNQTFINQFSKVITCQKEMKHKNKIITQQGLPWIIGKKSDKDNNIIFKTYNEFKNSNPEKNKLISVISSDKVFTECHKQRYDFVMKLKQYFGDKLDVYGRGINDIEDKWDAIADYKYHIVLENNSYENYWTEKLADCYLAGAYPFYYGCPNICDYFSENAYTPIDIKDFEKTVNIINDVINKDKYENSKSELVNAKNLILNEYNLFALIEKYCNGNNNNKQINYIYPDGSKKLKKLKSISQKVKEEWDRFLKKH